MSSHFKLVTLNKLSYAVFLSCFVVGTAFGNTESNIEETNQLMEHKVNAEKANPKNNHVTISVKSAGVKKISSGDLGSGRSGGQKVNPDNISAEISKDNRGSGKSE